MTRSAAIAAAYMLAVSQGGAMLRDGKTYGPANYLQPHHASHDAQQTGKARAAQRTVTQAADDARQAEVIRRGAVIRSERKFDDFTLRTLEMPKKTEFGTEIVTRFLFDAPHAATIACQEVGEPVF